MKIPSIRTLIIVILLLNILDATLTYQLVVIDKIATEANPLMAYLIDWNPIIFILFKISFLTTIFAGLYYLLPDRFPKTGTFIICLSLGLIILLLIYVVVYGAAINIANYFGKDTLW